jgi:hypothetical protein
MLANQEMMANHQELDFTLERLPKFQRQVAHVRNVETNPAYDHGSASGFRAEIDGMQWKVREGLGLHRGDWAKNNA